MKPTKKSVTKPEEKSAACAECGGTGWTHGYGAGALESTGPDVCTGCDGTGRDPAFGPDFPRDAAGKIADGDE